MIDLSILVFIEVQADLTSISFHLSSLPISSSHPFKYENMERTFTTCLKKYVEGCKKVKKEEFLLIHASCIIQSFTRCILEDPIYQKASNAESIRSKQFKEHKKIILFGDCLLQWYGQDLRKG